MPNPRAESRLATLDLTKPARATDPAFYIAEPGLQAAVEVSLAVGQPLLVTGEPGTGKTQLAGWIAHELGLADPLEYNVKTTSVARDLFYEYDALRHFHDVHLSVAQAQGGRVRNDETAPDEKKAKDIDVEDYVEYNALGVAILLSNEPGTVEARLPDDLAARAPSRSVVLIDEIDKAPRDLPNDLLNELQNTEFTVKELRRAFTADPKLQPIVVFTSNSERTLPDAFLRRCVYYHIAFPQGDTLERIVRCRLEELSHDDDDGQISLDDGEFTRALELFSFVRDESTQKKPATAELIAWVRVLDREKKAGRLDLRDTKIIDKTLPLLTKTKDDLLLVSKRLPEKLQASPNP